MTNFLIGLLLGSLAAPISGFVLGYSFALALFYIPVFFSIRKVK